MEVKLDQRVSKAMGICTMVLMLAAILFSSCNFRKSFEEYYNIPLSKSLNVVKATVSTQNICAVAQIDLLKQSAKEHKADLELHLYPADHLSCLAKTANDAIANHSPKSVFHRAVPFYILYSNIKICS